MIKIIETIVTWKRSFDCCMLIITYHLLLMQNQNGNGESIKLMGSIALIIDDYLLFEQN